MAERTIAEELAALRERLAKRPPPPSGTYCPDCRLAGMLHCAHPEECGGQIPWPKQEG